MRNKLFHFLVISIFVSSCGNINDAKSSEYHVFNIDHEDFLSLTQANEGVILDVRTKEETL